MKNFKITILILLASLLGVSCESDDIFQEEIEAKVFVEEKAESRNAILTFGRYFGKCEGEYCVRVFKLKNKHVKESLTNHHPVYGEFYGGKFLPIDVSEKINISQLYNDFPIALLETKGTFSIIGMPDAGDWGGIYLEYKKGNVHKQWLLDLNTNNVPKNLRNYINLINEKVSQIE